MDGSTRERRVWAEVIVPYPTIPRLSMDLEFFAYLREIASTSGYRYRCRIGCT